MWCPKSQDVVPFKGKNTEPDQKTRRKKKKRPAPQGQTKGIGTEP